MNHPPVITGLGLISCAGLGTEPLRDALQQAAPQLSRLPETGTAHLRCREAGLIVDPAATDALRQAGFATFDRLVPLALVAARQALSQAGLDPAALGPRCGLVFSTCSGPMLLIEAHYERLVAGNKALTPQELLAKRYYTAGRVLAHALGIQGVNNTVVTACSASTAAIALAADLVRSGLLDAALAGGADAFSLSTLAGFDGLKATCEARCAPFSKPVGPNLGEAGAFVVVESFTHARQRGAHALAHVLGSGMSNDAFHPSAPEPAGRGLADAMTRALSDAALEGRAIAYINAHGTGTEANDKAETRAIRRVFGDLATQVPISSTKSTVGHCLGAAGALEAIASITCAQAGFLPPTSNFTEPREGCSLDYLAPPARPWTTPKVFLNNNAAFGGHNASLVIHVPDSRPTDLAARPQPPLAPVWITGIGLVCNQGTRLPRPEAATPPSTPPPALFSGTPRAARVDDDWLRREAGRRLDLRGMDAASRFATLAAHMALREAGWPDKPASRADLGLFLNLSAGPSWAESTYLTSFLSHNRQVQELAPFPFIVPSSVAGNVCRTLHLGGHNVTLCSGPGAGLLGLGHAAVAIQNGHTQALLCGAVDELSDRILEDLAQAGLLASHLPPPGEGAVMLLLEHPASARARGATPIAEILGFAWATETRTPTGPCARQDPLDAVVAEALRRANQHRAEVASSPAHEVAVPIASFASSTGRLEASQELLDLAACLLEPTPVSSEISPVHLAVVDSPIGLQGALFVRRTQKPN